MKKKIVLGAIALLVVALFSFSLTGCDWFLSAVAAPQGYVIDAKTGDPISGATVTLTPLDAGKTASFTAVTSTNGYYSFLNVEYGKFELTASHTTHNVFTKQVVEVSGLAQYLPNIGGFTAVASDLSVIVFWDRDFNDVDAYMTYPTAEEAWDYGTYGFYQPLSGTRSPMGPFADVISDSDGPVLQKDVDNYGAPSKPLGGPETFTVSWVTFDNAAYTGPDYTATANDASKLPAGDYDYQGALVYYLEAYNATNKATDTAFGAAQAAAMLVSAPGATLLPANPVVYVFYGSDQLARYTLPGYTDIKKASLLRINTFLNSAGALYFQIIPEIKLAQTYKGLADEIIVVGGVSR